MDWYLKVLKQFSDFDGRARRKEYWMFVLFNFIFSICAMLIDTIIGLTIGLYLIYNLAMLVPGMAVSIRRLHDIGKSGWMILIALIPIIGAIWLIVLLATDGTPGENEYGVNPKEMAV